MNVYYVPTKSTVGMPQRDDRKELILAARQRARPCLAIGEEVFDLKRCNRTKLPSLLAGFESAGRCSFPKTENVIKG